MVILINDFAVMLVWYRLQHTLINFACLGIHFKSFVDTGDLHVVTPRAFSLVPRAFFEFKGVAKAPLMFSTEGRHRFLFKNMVSNNRRETMQTNHEMQRYTPHSTALNCFFF